MLWLLDALRVDLDSLRREGDYVATDYPTDLSNILFNYGVRLQPNVLLDATSTRIALNTGRLDFSIIATLACGRRRLT